MRRQILIVTAAALAGVAAALVQGLLLPAPVLAHGGALDANGCHNDRKNGGYHCHRAPAAPSQPTARPATSSPIKPASAAAGIATPPVAALDLTGTIDFYESPNGGFQRFSADQIARDKLTFTVEGSTFADSRGKQWTPVRVRYPASGLTRVGYVEVKSGQIPTAVAVAANAVEPSSAASPSQTNGTFDNFDRRTRMLILKDAIGTTFQFLVRDDTAIGVVGERADDYFELNASGVPWKVGQADRTRALFMPLLVLLMLWNSMTAHSARNQWFAAVSALFAAAVSG